MTIPAVEDADALVRSLRESEFSVTALGAYLDHATQGAVPRRAADALRRYSATCERPPEAAHAEAEAALTRVRATLGRLLNCEPRQLAFVPSTSDGMGIALDAVGWRPGDNVVLAEGEHPSVKYPCDKLAGHGVEVRRAPAPDGRVLAESLIDRLDRRTRVLAVSHVRWSNGFKADLGAIAEACRTREALLFVDAIQSLGVEPLDLADVQPDILVSGCFKWLLGIPGVAVMYVGDRALAQLSPSRPGRLSATDDAFARGELVYRDDARRFLCGSLSVGAIDVVQVSADLLLEVGPGRVHARTHGLVDTLARGLSDLKLRITSDLSPPHRSSILTFTLGEPRRDSALVAHLRARRVFVCHRAGGVRVSPHFYNDASDIEALLDGVECWKDSEVGA
jgi:selenocysteine lyase/cysteine desulfurase